MLKLESRPTDPVKLAKMALGAIVGTMLLMVGVAELAARHQQAEYDDDRLSLSLKSTDHYFDATAVTPREGRPSLASGLTGPRTDLSPRPEDYR